MTPEEEAVIDSIRSLILFTKDANQTLGSLRKYAERSQEDVVLAPAWSDWPDTMHVTKFMISQAIFLTLQRAQSAYNYRPQMIGVEPKIPRAVKEAPVAPEPANQGREIKEDDIWQALFQEVEEYMLDNNLWNTRDIDVANPARTLINGLRRNLMEKKAEIYRAEICQPSTHDRHHALSRTKVIVKDYDPTSPTVRVFFTEGTIISMEMARNCLFRKDQ